MMKNIARGLLALVALFFIGPGLMLMFSPESFSQGLMIEPIGIGGLSHTRALFGGAIAAIGFSVLIAVVTEDFNQARPAVLYMVLILIARTVGYFVDGSFPTIVQYFVIPALVFAVLVIAHKLIDKANVANQ